MLTHKKNPFSPTPIPPKKTKEKDEKKTTTAPVWRIPEIQQAHRNRLEKNVFANWFSKIPEEFRFLNGPIETKPRHQPQKVLSVS